MNNVKEDGLILPVEFVRDHHLIIQYILYNKYNKLHFFEMKILQVYVKL